MANVNKPYRLLPHTTDAYIATSAKTLEEAFENAAFGMFDVMTDSAKVESKREQHVTVEGGDFPNLLYNWLEALLVKFDTEELLLSEFHVEQIRKRDSGYVLSAKVKGEQFDRGKHPSKVEVKAVTYHGMEIREQEGRFELKFILDL